MYSQSAIKLRHLFKKLEALEADFDMAKQSRIEMKFLRAGLKSVLTLIDAEGDEIGFAEVTAADLKRWRSTIIEFRSLRAGNGTPNACLPKSQQS